jgi:glyoxylase-like metal-dependent hydrolase (beta-lactamase superfamily II)
MLLDFGPAPADDDLRPRLSEVAREGPIDLLVMTHIDTEHIEGAILLTNEADVGLEIAEVWSDGSGQLVPELNAVHGEIFWEKLSKRPIPWNVQFDRGRTVLPQRSARSAPFLAACRSPSSAWIGRCCRRCAATGTRSGLRSC